MIEAAVIGQPVTGRRMGLVIAASSIGTVFEWYDFFIFGSLATIIAKHFFASAGDTLGYIFALLTFAAGFAVRPLGALVFGAFGDRSGRKRAFLVTITLMGVATFAIGLTPDTAQIGPLAPYILIGLRVLQGFAVGGEYGGAAIYVAEHADPKRRGGATGWIQVAATAGLFLALAVILSLRTLMGEDVFGDWGWRAPFLLSVVLLVISLWIRLRLDESPLFQRMKAEGRESRAPLREAFFVRANLRLVLIVLFGLMTVQGAVWYTAQFYTQTFLERVLKVDPRMMNLMVMAVAVVAMPLHIIFARLSDQIGRKPIMLFGIGLAVLTFMPGFQLLTEAVNPALAHATATSPVVVAADPGECTLQFDPIGKTKFLSSCDIAKATLSNLGVPYRNEAAPAGTARVRVGSREITSFDGRGLSAPALSTARGSFEAALKAALKNAGYPPSAATNKIDVPRALLILVVFVTAAAALYGPQAAALVELFPTRIRYSAISLPYHIGNGWIGGFLPAIAFAIVAATGNIYAGLWYPIIVAAIGFVVTLFFLPETKGRDITG
jgi:predicted MFS family arabinose efflux permease